MNRGGERVEFQSFHITDEEIQKVSMANLKPNKTFSDDLSKDKTNSNHLGSQFVTELYMASESANERMI